MENYSITISVRVKIFTKEDKMINYQLLQTITYRLSFATIASITASFLGYIGLGLSDQMFGTSYQNEIDKMIEQCLKIETLKANSESKNSSDILYNHSSIYYGNSINDAYIKQEVLKAYQELEQNPILKYFVYVNALNAINNDDSHVFLDRESWYYKMFKNSQNLIGGLKLDEAGGAAMDSDNTIMVFFRNSITSKFLTSVAHEMTHTGYNLVYDNSLNPYASNDFSMKKVYLNSINGINNYALKLVEEGAEKIKEDSIEAGFIKEAVLFIQEEWSGRLGMNTIAVEAIAHYSSVIARGDDEVASKFIGFKEYIQEYTIPDFIKYIENHPKCNKINYSDESIHCRVAGEILTSIESEL